MKTLVGLLALIILPALAAPEHADLVLHNGRIYTADAARPWIDAVAVAGDRIIAAGAQADIDAVRGPQTRVIDLRGAFALPGFNDAHVHVEATGALLVGVNLLDVHDAAAFTERIREATTRVPKGSWITRGDWGAYEQWLSGSAGTPSGRSSPDASSGKTQARTRDAARTQPFLPDRSLIDAVTPDHPVLVNRFDRSVYLANSLALTLAGVSEATAPPAGGEIARDGSGRITGVLRGAAVDLVRKRIPPLSLPERLVHTRAVLREAREAGVTTLQDLTSAAQLRAYQELLARGELTARILLRPTLDNVEHTAALGVSRGFGNDWLKFIGYKAWVDGIMGNSSALFFEPYSHDAANRGIIRDIMLPEGRDGAALAMTTSQRYTDFPEGNLERLLRRAAASGLPPHVHAIGDKANRILLDLYEKVLRESGLTGTDHRWRVIHAQVVRAEDMPRFGQLRLVAEINPYHVSDDMRWMEERIGEARARGAYAFRSLKRFGAVLVFGSDSPGTNAARYPLNPMSMLYAAVTRQTLGGEPKGGWYPDERLTIEEAIDAATRASAWASFEEDRKGTIAVGQLADIAVYDIDLIDAGRRNPQALLKAVALYTIAGGRVVYARKTS